MIRKQLALKLSGLLGFGFPAAACGFGDSGTQTSSGNGSVPAATVDAGSGVADAGGSGSNAEDAGSSELPASDFTPASGSGTAPPNAPGPGPWTMRLMIATSTDGLTFTRTGRILSDQADVPDAIIGPNGWIYLYYIAWKRGDEQNKIAVALSNDNGTTWAYKKVNMIGFDQMGPPCDPEIQPLDDGTFRLYVTSSENRGSPSTYYAESTDGFNFTKKGIAFSKSGKNVLDPSVIRIGDTWHIFAGGGTSTRGAVFHGTSTSGGTRFTESQELTFTIDDDGQMMANGIAVDGGYRFFTFGNKKPSKISSLFTTDGTTWTAESGTRLAPDTSSSLEKQSEGVKDPAVVRLASGTYVMVYAAMIP